MTQETTKIETVTMIDGRVVDFAGKRKMLKSSSVTDAGAVVVRLDFRNGQTRDFTIPAPLLPKCASHGAEQKLGDEIAGLEDVDDCVLAIDSLIDRLYNGDWAVKRESSGMAGTSILVRALVEYSSKPVDIIKTYLAGKSQAEKIALRSSKGIKPIVERMESEKTSTKEGIDTDALLSELN